MRIVNWLTVAKGTAAVCALFGAMHSFTASAAEPIKIGLLLPYTGVFASISEDMTRGFMLAVDELGGQVAGRPIAVIKGDTELKPNVALQQLDKILGSDKVDIVVGGASSSEAFALRDALVKRKKPLVNILAASDSLTRELCNPYLVRTSFSATAFESAMGRWLASQGVKKAFTMAPDYSAGHEVIGSFQKGFEEGGGKIVGQAWPAFRTTKDYAPFFAKAKESGADFIYAFFGGAEAIQVVKQHADFGLKKTMPLYGSSWVYDVPLLPAQGDAALGAKFLTLYLPDLPGKVNEEFVKRYTAKYGARPSTPAVFGYDAAKSTMLGLQKLKGDVSKPEKVAPAIASASYESPRGLFKIDPKTQNVINERLYVAEVSRNGNALEHKLVEAVKGFPDSGEGCKMN